jgi:hypothetical protein
MRKRWDDYIDIPVPKTRWCKKVAYKFKNNRVTRERHLLQARRETRGHKQNLREFRARG